MASAATNVELVLKTKLDRDDLSGSKLVGQAFSLEPASTDRPRLRLPGHGSSDGERFRSAHVGAMHLGQGCFEGIRNWAAHTVDEPDEQVAIEYLAALSVFARWVDQPAVDRG